MEHDEAAIRSAEIRSEGGNPIRFHETANVRPGIIIATASGLAWEGTIPELGKAGIFDKPDLLVFCHPHTKAGLDAKIKKAERKFKPGEAVPLKSAPKDPYAEVAEKMTREALNTTDLQPFASSNPALGMPYQPDGNGKYEPRDGS
jgi:hypothetical protein